MQAEDRPDRHLNIESLVREACSQMATTAFLHVKSDLSKQGRWIALDFLKIMTINYQLFISILLALFDLNSRRWEGRTSPKISQCIPLLVSRSL